MKEEIKIDLLRRQGYVVLNDFLPGNNLPGLLSEYDSFINNNPAATVSGDDIIYPTTINKIKEAGLHQLSQALAPGWLGEVGGEYFQINQSLPVTFASLVDSRYKGFEGVKGNAHWHWDPTLELRLMIYFSNAGIDSGALQVIPGTHFDNHKIRLASWQNESEFSESPDFHGDIKDSITIEGKPGTAILFDTGITHRRSQISEGKFRKAGFSFVRSPLAETFYRNEKCPADIVKLWPHKKDSE